jgi:cobalt-zinc-cadmium efflux system outer membrane protein
MDYLPARAGVFAGRDWRMIAEIAPWAHQEEAGMNTVRFALTLIVCLSAPAIAQLSPRPDEHVRLEDLVREALDRNPAILSARRAVDAKRARVAPEGSLPDPSLSFQTMGNLIPPTLQGGDPSSYRMIGFEQEIPFPGKLALRRKIAIAEAEAQFWDYEQLRRQIIAQLKLAYYDLYFVDRAIEVVQRDKGLLEKIAQIAEARYKVGQGLMQDVLRAQLELSKLLDRATSLQRRRAAIEAMINALLYRQPDARLGKPILQKSELKYSLEGLYQIALSNYPELKAQERQIDRNAYALRLAERNFYPDFSVGFAYANRAGLPDMYALTFNLKLPLYFWRRQRPELEGAASELAAARKWRENTIATLYLKLKDAYLMATTSERLAELYGAGVIRQATMSLESALAGYQVGKVDFSTVIENLTALLEYELKYHEAVVDYQKALAQLESMVGVELVR